MGHKATPVSLEDLLDGTWQQFVCNHETYGWDTKAKPTSFYDFLGGTLKQIVEACSLTKTYWVGHYSKSCLLRRPTGGILKQHLLPQKTYSVGH